MTRPVAHALLLAAALLPLAGCPDGDDPDDAPPTANGEGEAEAEGAPDDEGDGDEAPLAGSIFTREELFAIYAAYMDDDEAARERVLREHRLIDATGAEDPARVQAYDRALKRYAERDPDGWAEFVDSLGAPPPGDG